MSNADLSQLTVVVSTADRPKSLGRLKRSLRKCAPQLPLLVADNSQQASSDAKRGVLSMPAGTGHGVGWNALLARLRTPYFLLLDDRCQLARDTDLRQLLQLVVDDQLDIAAGNLIACRRQFWLFVRRRIMPGQGLLQLGGQELVLRPGYRSEGDGFRWCDLVHDFFIARTDKVRSLGGWDPELGNEVREEFFVRAHRHGLRVGVVPEVTAACWLDPSESAEKGPDRRSLAVAKMGLSRMVDFDDQVIKAPRRSQAA